MGLAFGIVTIISHSVHSGLALPLKVAVRFDVVIIHKWVTFGIYPNMNRAAYFFHAFLK